MINANALLKEVEFQTALSGGPGGQHVNKTETKVILIWDIDQSELFSESQKEQLKRRLASRINASGLLKLSVSETRSQLQNKKIAISTFQDLVKKALQKPKKRLKTKPSRAAKLKRLQKKKQLAEKKQLRKKPKY
jgi:ribosome-associated protein